MGVSKTDPRALRIELRGGVARTGWLSLATRLLRRANQLGKPWRRLNEPGDRRSLSLALTVSSAEYVESGVISGWNSSVWKVTSGGRRGKASGKEIVKRRMAEE